MAIETVDELVKLVLGLSLSFAIVGIAFQIMRLIGKVTDSLQDVRGALRNASSLTDYILSDYIAIRKKIISIFDKEVGLIGKLSIAKSILSIVDKLLDRKKAKKSGKNLQGSGKEPLKDKE